MIVAALTLSSPSARSWARWRSSEPSLDQADFEELRGELPDTATKFERRDEILGALVRIGRIDPTAWLAVVVVLLPGLRRSVRRFGRFLDADERWATILAGLWEQLGHYDVARRPQHVAANLVWDATGALLRASRREETVVDHSAPFDEKSAVSVHVDDLDSDPLRPAIGAGVLTDLDAALIDATRLRGIGLRDAAALLGLSYEAAKKRRRRAEVAWAQWWDPHDRRIATCSFVAAVKAGDAAA